MRHPLLLHRAVVALCRRSAWAGGDWRDLCGRSKWHYDPERVIEFDPDYRMPPLPFYSEFGERAPEGLCRVCRQPIYKHGSHDPRSGPRHPSATWHRNCYAAYEVWNKPGSIIAWLLARQGGLCAYGGGVIGRLVELHPKDWRRGPNPHPDDPRWRYFHPQTHEWRPLLDVEVDHEVPLWKVQRMTVSWPRVLNYWGPANLRAVSITQHRAKSRAEAGERARLRASSTIGLEL
jgi:hypothetical protein